MLKNTSRGSGYVQALITLFLIMSLVSCLKDNFEFDELSGKVSYQPSFLIPLANGSLTLGNILEPDDSLIFFDDDNSIRIMIREDSLYSINVSDILDLNKMDPVSRQFRMDPVPIDDFSLSAIISLRDLTDPRRLNEPESSAIRYAHGSNSVFPLLHHQYPGRFPAGELENIYYAHLTAGTVEMKAVNNLPVEVTMDIALINEADGSYAGHFIFHNLGAGEEQSVTASLEGVVVRNRLILELLSFSSPGSDEDLVSINLEDALHFEISTEDLLAVKGNVRIPPTVLDTARDTVNLNFNEDQEVEELNIESGSLVYEIPDYSDGLALKIDFTNAGIAGSPYEFELSTSGRGGVLNDVFEMNDVDLDFSTSSDLLIDYMLVVGSESGFTEFDLTSGLFDFNMEFRNMILGSAKGYFGQEVLVSDDEVIEIDTELFSKLTGDFLLTNPSARLFYNNSVGVPVNLSLNLHAESADLLKESTLLDEAHEGFLLNFPVEPGNSVSDEIVLDRESSNIAEFISLPPSKIKLNANAQINPSGKTAVPNFISSGSSFNMGMEIELPLEMQLTDLGLTDTLGIDLSGDDIDFIDKLTLTLEVSNSFPLGVQMDLNLYDSISDMILYTFENVLFTGAAPVNEYGIVVAGSSVESVTEIEVSQEVTNHLKNTSHLIIAARLNTGKYNNQPAPVKFLTTDKLDFRIRLKAELKINN